MGFAAWLPAQDSGAAPDGKREARLPNVVVIFIDDMGYADIGTQGAKDYETPHLDRMAREGRRFTRWSAAQPVCSASRAALLTGCYPNRIGIHGALGPRSRTGIADSEMTMAEMFKQKGYATAVFGKWHLGDHRRFLPLQHGFDEYFGIPYSNDMWPFHPESGDRFPALPLIEGNERLRDADTRDQDLLTSWITARAVDFISRNRARPFFLYVPHPQCHVPLHVSERFRGSTKRGLFGDVMAELDWSVGEILNAIETAGLDEDTLVVFTSDNGPWLSYGEHAGSALPLREGKGTNWEGGTRVPCLMRWPGRIPAGTVSDAAAMHTDLLPTLAKLIGAALPDHAIDGRDVWGLISGNGSAAEGRTFWHYYHQNELQAVSHGPWKLYLPHVHRTLGGRPGGKDGIPVKYENVKLTSPELYRLDEDIGERKNLAGEEPEVVRQLSELAEAARAELGDRLTQREGKGSREPGRLTKEEGAEIDAWHDVP